MTRQRAASTAVLTSAILLACRDPGAPPSDRVLAFAVQPPRTAPGVTLKPAPRVEVRLSSGARDTASNVTITLVLGPDRPRARLLGTTVVRAVAGVAVFNDLRIDTSAWVSLYASAAGIPTASSRLFRAVVPFTTLAAGVTHSCGTTPDGRVYCWGANTYGQLGTGSTEPTLTPQLVQTPAGVRFTAVASGGLHSCALTTLGMVYCWGVNTSYELGDGSTEARVTPVPVHTPNGVTFTMLSVGYHHSCAVASGGATYCWGGNFYGQLGDGTETTPREPVAVASPAGVTFTAVSAGVWHTCAVTGEGAAYCWGANDYGALGDGTGDSSLTPTPVAVPGGVSFATVTAGSMHTCGVTSSGAAYCWGRGDTGQLGDGTTTSDSTPVAVVAPPGIGFRAISAGQTRTCAVSTGGAVYCWGQNGLLGLLGDGTTTDRPMPVPLTMPDETLIASVAVSVSETACALSPIGLAYCWGYNGFGQVGDGTATRRTTPGTVVQ